jgi:predicted membrane-bound spermidine synthase
VRVANGINITIGLLAWLLGTRTRSGSLDQVADLDDAQAILPVELPASVTGVALFVSGFATLAYEIVWFRALRYLFGVGAYALTVMLMVFLVGLGVGGALAARVRPQHAPARVLGYSQLGIALFAMIAIGAEYALLSSPGLWAKASAFSIGESGLEWQWRMMLVVLVALLMMLPATLLMGLSFPIASRLFLGDVRRLGERVGTAYLLANLGSLIGACAAAFVVLPYLGTIRGTLAIASGNILLGILILIRLPNADNRKVAWAIPPTIALFAMSVALPAQLPFPTLYRNLPDMDLLWSEEGDVATVQVWAMTGSPDRRGIFVDGTSIGESKGMRRTIWGKQRLLAHLPMALAPGAKTSLNVGFGSGSTLAALASYSEVERLDVVEFSAAVVRASQGFFPESDVLNDPRVNLDVEDVAHFLLRGDSRYDLIISDGKLVEWFSGNELMLCRDFYEHSKRRLMEDGIFIQWIGLMHPPDAFKVILRTFLASFPETEIFLDTSTGLYLVGSRLPIGTARAERLDRGFAREDLAVLDIPNMPALMSRWLVSGAQLRRVLGEGRISSWDHSIIEFLINRSDGPSLRNSRQPNLELLFEAKELGGPHPFLSPNSPYVQSSNLIALSLLASYRGDSEAAILFANKAARANPIDPSPKAVLKKFGQPVPGSQ